MDENKIEKLDMSKKPKEEVAVFGLGVLFGKLDRLIELQDRTNFLLSMLEKKFDIFLKSKGLNMQKA